MKLGIQKASPPGRVLLEAMRLRGERSQDTVLHDTNESGQTIMVVEDYTDTRIMLERMLEVKGYRVVQAADGWDAVKVALRERPDLILMDLDLPGLDGTTVMHLLREHEELHDVPIVAVTAYDRSYPPADAFASGCSEYLTKPIKVNQLESILSRFLHER